MTDMESRSRVIAHAVPRDVVVMPGFGSAASFELLQRQAKAFMESSMVPATYQSYTLDKESGEWRENKQAFSNCMIALNMAFRMQADPLMVMQNLYIVHGMPAWSAKFLIGLFNTCGRFTAIRYVFNEKRDTCFAYCHELNGRQLEGSIASERLAGPTVSLAMAKAEGWSLRKGNKWLTMPEVMLMNRAASFLIRATAPELSLGLPMRDEAEDIVDVEAREVSSPTALQSVRDYLREPSSVPTAARADVEPAVAAPPPPDDPEPVTPARDPEPEGDDVQEPRRLPIKDGELTPQDAQRMTPPLRMEPKVTAPAFNVDVYARRIRAVADIDLITLMRDEIAAFPPSLEREDLMTMINARTHEILGDTPIDDEGN